MLDKKTRDLVAFLDGSLRNCENVLFSNFQVEGVSNKDIKLRSDLTARQIAKLYGFAQKLLTKHVDQIGVGLNHDDSWYQDEIKPIRKAFVHRCNFILDKLEEHNSTASTSTSSEDVEAKEGATTAATTTGSVQNIMIVNGVVYGTIFLRQQQVSLFVPPIPFSEHSFHLDQCCHADQPSLISHFVSFLEFVVTSTQQRLLDDGVLENPSLEYNVTSFEGVAARRGGESAATTAIAGLPLLTRSSVSTPEDSLIHVSFHHPHEAALANMLMETSEEYDQVRLLLSEEGTYCHVSLVNLKSVQSDVTSGQVPTNSLLFQDKFLVKRLDSRSKKRTRENGANDGGVFFLSANQFVTRLESTISRALKVMGADDLCQWNDIDSVHFLYNGNDQSDSRILTEKNDLQMWLEAVLMTSISSTQDVTAGQESTARTTPSMHRQPHVTDTSLFPLFWDAAVVKTHCRPPIGSTIGVRVHNNLSIIKEDVTSKNGESVEQKTSFVECYDFIPFVEPFQTGPVCVRHRLQSSRSCTDGDAEAFAEAVIQIVEESRCINGISCTHDQNCRATHNHTKGRAVHSLLNGAVTVVPTPCQLESNKGSMTDSSSVVIDLFVEICVDEDHCVTLRVLDVNTLEELAISTSTSTMSLQSLSSGGSLKSLRSLQTRDEQFVSESSRVTHWSCDELASEYKQRGNAFMKDQDYFGAIEMYSVGLSCAAPGVSFGILASNRCAAYTYLNLLPAALEDARDCVRHHPHWEKGWARLGSVQFRMNCLDESLLSYEKAVSFAPTNVTILDALQEVRDVVMVRQAEAAALEARSKADGQQSPLPKSHQPGTKKGEENNCNDVCVIS
mmetsp:Transcript_8730/g.14844  ORF Transcript_8730/g.14844 Transcript_8730/m.14844 type:complete len:843 (+) Transcript_8730:81-2609(+)